ncbi:Putative pentatricopeptide repeat-containing protein At4g17915 [Linum grandiflorum]
MEEAGVGPDVISFNSLITAATRRCLFHKATYLFDEMLQRNISPVIWTLNTLMHSFFLQREPEEAYKILNILIDGLCKAGKLGAARRVIREFEAFGHAANAITYITMMNCWFKSKKFNQGFRVLEEMRSKGYTYDGFGYYTALGALLKVGKVEEAAMFKEEMIKNGIELDLVSYNTLMTLSKTSAML